MNNEPHTWIRLYVEAPLAAGGRLTLDEKQSHYLKQVMRLREGDPLRLFNGRDGEWRALVSQEARGKRDPVLLQVEEQLREQSKEPDIWLCAAPLKKNYFDFMIMKATELGISVLQPILTQRTQIRDVNLDHARAIAIEASEQSERLTVPEIRAPLPLEKLLESWPAHRLAILCAEHGEAYPIAQALSGALAGARDTAAVITGPEGGFLTEEIEKIRALPETLAVRLGPRILRADTAALAALACWQSQRGDWQRRDVSKRET